MVTNYVKYHPIKAICPGETIQETMECMGWTPEVFAKMLNITLDELSNLLQGSIPVTVELANKLQEATGTSASIWLAFEARYKEVSELLAQEEKLQPA